ncbi:MAG: tetratricopeptide repeat protein [Paraglaciecola sp.]|uniref:tetratricopeptide repeat protein n=1 Tax=Paraglaciecola sp. TaxID=1920173 RepID=UPI0032978C8D
MKSILNSVVHLIRFLCVSLLFLPFMVLSDTAQDYEEALLSFNQEKFRESYIHLKNALQKTPSHLPSKLLIGRIFLLDGYPEAAITEFEEIVQAGADLNLVVIPLANAYLMNGQYDKIIDLNIPNNANLANQLDLFILKANAYIQQNKYTLAENLFMQAKQKFGNDIRVLNGLSQMAMLNNRFAEAKQIITEALLNEPNNAQSHLLNGLIYQAERQHSKALIAFESAYQISPKDPAIMRALANSYAQKGEISKASKIVSEIEIQTPNSLQTKLLKARLLAMAEKNEEADVVLAELSQTLSLYDKTDNQYLSKMSVVAGIIAHLNQNYDVSVRELSRYLDNEEPTAELIAMLAEGYIRTNDSKAATQLLERYEALILDNIQIASLSCDLYLSKNKTFKCDSLVQQLKQRHGDDSQEVLLLEAKTLNRRNHPQKALDILQTTLAENKNVDTTLFRASLLASLGKYKESLIDAQRLLKISPRKLDYLLLNIDLSIRLNDFEAAKALLKTVFEQDKDNLAGLIHQSRIQFSLGDLQGASASIQKVIEMDKANFAGLLLRGQILIKQNQLNDAADQLIAAKTINPTNTSPRELLISIYKQQESFNLAISELNQLLKIRPSEPKYIYEKAKVYLSLEQPLKAKRELDLLFFQWEKQPEKLVQLSHLQLAIKDIEGAESSLKNALKLAPDLLIIQLEYSNFLLNQKAYAQVEPLILKMQKSTPNNSNVHLIHGNFYRETGNLERAYQYYQRAYTLAPNYTAVLIELYKLASQNIHRDDIVEIFSNRIESNPDASFVRHLYADLLFLTGNMSEASKHYEKLILVENLPNKSSVFNNLANILSNIDIERALSYAQESAKLTPNSSSILDTLGWLHTQNNNPQQGLNILRQAFTLNSDSPTIRYHLGYTLNKLGRIQEAKSELALALASKQNFEEREQAESLLLTL